MPAADPRDGAPDDSLRDRIVRQFSDRGERADVWRAFDWFLDTDRFLNLGYSAWYQPHLGGSQRRLVDVVGSTLAGRLPETAGVRLLDVGCGRGGPTIRLADRHGFRAVGVDLVPHNVARARANAGVADASFVVGDAAALPVGSRSMAAATAIDAVVYLLEPAAVFAELSRVLQPDGLLVLTDLLSRPSPTERERAALDAFADAWDMPSIRTIPAYRRALEAGGFEVATLADLTAHSVGRFRRWTSLYRRLARGPPGRLLHALLRRRGVDPVAIDQQIDRAHRALPALRHALVVATPAAGGD